jgi:hypothetical protein
MGRLPFKSGGATHRRLQRRLHQVITNIVNIVPAAMEAHSNGQYMRRNLIDLLLWLMLHVNDVHVVYYV